MVYKLEYTQHRPVPARRVCLPQSVLTSAARSRMGRQLGRRLRPWQMALSRAYGSAMFSFSGLTFLVVEDEPLIAMDITMALEEVGAEVTSTTSVKRAKLLVEHDGLAAAILDHSLGDGDSSALRARLKERGIPFLVYSGFEATGAPHLAKPATPAQLIAALRAIIS